MTDEQDAASAFEHAPVGLILSSRRVVLRANARMAIIFGHARHELEGRSLSVLYPSEDEFDRIGAEGLKRMLEQNYYADERIMKRRNGDLFWCRVRGHSMTPDNPFERSVWSFADLSDQRPIVNLTRRERQVAMYLAEGLTSKEIARRLEISHRTVEAHRARLNGKLNVRNTAEFIARMSGLPH